MKKYAIDLDIASVFPAEPLLHRLHGSERLSGKEEARPFRNVFDLEMGKKEVKIQPPVFGLHRYSACGLRDR